MQTSLGNLSLRYWPMVLIVWFSHVLVLSYLPCILFPFCLYWVVSLVYFQAHVVAAFEQSLSNMTHRLQHLTSTSEQKVRPIVFLARAHMNLTRPTWISQGPHESHKGPHESHKGPHESHRVLSHSSYLFCNT